MHFSNTFIQRSIYVLWVLFFRSFTACISAYCISSWADLLTMGCRFHWNWRSCLFVSRWTDSVPFSAVCSMFASIFCSIFPSITLYWIITSLHNYGLSKMKHSVVPCHLPCLGDILPVLTYLRKPHYQLAWH